jgi:hypothetical protein
LDLLVGASAIRHDADQKSECNFRHFHFQRPSHRHMTSYRVSVRIGGNAASPIPWQTRSNPRFKQFQLRYISGEPRTGKTELPLGSIDTVNFRRRAARDDQLREGAVAASNVDPAQTSARSQPIQENIASDPAPDSHHALIGGPVVEADFLFGHQ